MEKKEKVIEIRNLYKAFGDNAVLEDFSMDLYDGENLVVLGKSGSGKSVLIKCIIGLLRPDAGSITVLGKDISKLNHAQLDELRVHVGFLFQSNALYDSMTVRANLEFPMRRHRFTGSPKEMERLILESLDDVGLAHTIDMMPEELSGGMRKRIALARTLILRPDIILYDEPTTGLDPITAQEIIRLMMKIKEKYNTASIIISHDMNCVEETADRVVMLIDRKCYAQGTFQSLKDYSDPKVNSFFQPKRLLSL
ncbi:ATP-binding cassette domain-containing protein [Sediminibacterium roseum]|uniref:ATP-binding cassette domain-containing protein n=1 Tax=Sediminibacterium roseum TaxID=1978412 RepID=A0ABX0A166_9BACT|nr:ATP-binding cassette domain-containing protein [Sediminibacterium roseum]NCI52048.1 ATP-binding cassette domain-containing protein [Sediminibacterium roseum]